MLADDATLSKAFALGLGAAAALTASYFLQPNNEAHAPPKPEEPTTKEDAVLKTPKLTKTIS